MAFPAQQAVYRFGGFVLDLGRGALSTADGAPIPLRPKSFALLQLLVENAGRLMERDAIMAALWPKIYVTDDSITQCMRDVRRALGPDAGEFLRTVNGRGYRFVADVTVERLPSRPGPSPRGERTELSLMFSAIGGFAKISGTLDPMELSRITSVYFEAVTRELLAYGATIDKYIGDRVMAYWNAPHADPDHAARACMAVLRTHAVTVRLAETFVRRGWPPLPTTFGIHTGEAVVGTFGCGDRVTYTAMGAAVNFASRLTGLNKCYGTRILVSEATRAAAGPGFVFQPIDAVTPADGDAPMAIYALLGVSGSIGLPRPSLVQPPGELLR